MRRFGRRTDDPLADFDRWDAEQASYEARLPRCAYCGEPIWEYYFIINGEMLCEECLHSNFRKDVDDYIEQEYAND